MLAWAWAGRHGRQRAPLVLGDRGADGQGAGQLPAAQRAQHLLRLPRGLHRRRAPGCLAAHLAAGAPQFACAVGTLSDLHLSYADAGP